MSDPKTTETTAKPEWRMPTLFEDNIAEITHNFTSAGIDAYEAQDASIYGS